MPQEQLLDLIKTSDLYITKSGGLSPTEAFAIGVPTLLLDIYGGHEKRNAKLFKEEGLAKINTHPTRVGKEAFELMGDEIAKAQQMKAQEDFRRNLHFDPILDFAFKGKSTKRPPSERLGVENGQMIAGTEVIRELDRRFPSEVEIILSFSSQPDTKIKNSPNPFGHIALRVGGIVYTANHLANPDKEPVMLHGSSLEDYLYGTRMTWENQEFGSSVGLAYARDNLSLRLKGFHLRTSRSHA